MASEALLIKLIRFGTVGISGMLVDFSVTYIFRDILKIRKYISNSLGFVTAVTTNFYLNRTWTFQSSNADLVPQFLEFLSIAIIGLLINNFIIYFLTDLKFRLNFYLSKVIATGIVFIWNFTINNLVTFRSF